MAYQPQPPIEKSVNYIYIYINTYLVYSSYIVDYTSTSNETIIYPTMQCNMALVMNCSSSTPQPQYQTSRLQNAEQLTIDFRVYLYISLTSKYMQLKETRKKKTHTNFWWGSVETCVVNNIRVETFQRCPSEVPRVHSSIYKLYYTTHTMCPQLTTDYRLKIEKDKVQTPYSMLYYRQAGGIAM